MSKLQGIALSHAAASAPAIRALVPDGRPQRLKQAAENLSSHK